MSKVYYHYRITEIQVDKDGNEIAAYDVNLPHHDIIADYLCGGWNDMHMERFFDGILTGNIQSAVMKVKKLSSGESEAVVAIEAKRGFRLSQKRRNEIFSQMSAQFVDGWGESYLDSGNILKAQDGTMFFPA